MTEYERNIAVNGLRDDVVKLSGRATCIHKGILAGSLEDVLQQAQALQEQAHTHEANDNCTATRAALEVIDNTVEAIRMLTEIDAGQTVSLPAEEPAEEQTERPVVQPAADIPSTETIKNIITHVDHPTISHDREDITAADLSDHESAAIEWLKARAEVASSRWQITLMRDYRGINKIRIDFCCSRPYEMAEAAVKTIRKSRAKALRNVVAISAMSCLDRGEKPHVIITDRDAPKFNIRGDVIASGAGHYSRYMAAPAEQPAEVPAEQPAEVPAETIPAPILDADVIAAALQPAEESITDRLRSIPGLDITTRKSTIWISGQTYPVKEQLKAMGCRWSGKRKAWYYQAPRPAAVIPDGLTVVRQTSACTWVDGPTDLLQAAGAKWSAKRQAWYVA